MFAFRPAKALPLLLLAEENAYSTSEKPCAPGFAMLETPGSITTAIAVPMSAAKKGNSTASEAIFIS